MVSPDELETRFTLRTAVDRLDALRAREALSATPGEGETVPSGSPAALTQDEALELLALSEVVGRKAAYGRQLTVRSARRAGASWSRIGAALGTSKQAAWEAHSRWIDGQAADASDAGHIGWEAAELVAARALAGRPDSDDGGSV